MWETRSMSGNGRGPSPLRSSFGGAGATWCGPSNPIKLDDPPSPASDACGFAQPMVCIASWRKTLRWARGRWIVLFPPEVEDEGGNALAG